MSLRKIIYRYTPFHGDSFKHKYPRLDEIGLSQESGKSRRIGLGPMLDVLNLINLIIHFREELEQIRRGRYTSGLFSRQNEKKLIRLGIIEKDNNGYVVSWEVKALMDRLK